MLGDDSVIADQEVAGVYESAFISCYSDITLYVFLPKAT